MKFLKHLTLVVLFLILVSGVFYYHSKKTSALGPYLASDIFGQTDINGDPIYTKFPYNNNGQNSELIHTGSSVTVDEVNHFLFVSETAWNRINVYELNSSNEFVDYNADYIIGQPDFYTETSGLSVAKLNAPTDIEYDSTNEMLFVSDTGNHRVLAYDLSLGITTGMDASYVLGQADFDTASTGLSSSTFNTPKGLGLSEENNLLYVADKTNNRVLVFDLSTIATGMTASKVLGQPDFDSSGTFPPGQQNDTGGPDDMIVDDVRDYLFVSEELSRRVTIFEVGDLTEITNNENAIYVLCQENFSTRDDSTVSDNRMSNPFGLALDGNNLFVTDNVHNRILVFDTTVISNGMSASYVLGQNLFTTDTAVTSVDGLNNPRYMEIIGSTDMLLVADAGSHRILNFDISTLSNGLDAVSLIGHNNFLNVPDFDDDLLPDSNLSSRVFPINDYGFTSPNARRFVIDNVNHRLFVPDSKRILIFNLDSNNDLVDRHADYVLGQSTMYVNGSNAIAQNSIGFAFDLAYDEENERLFVADTGFKRVVVYDLSLGITNNMNASFVLGQPDFVSSNLDLSPTSLDEPGSIEYDPAHQRLFVHDNLYTYYSTNFGGNSYYSRIVVYDVNDIVDYEPAVNVLGAIDFYTGSFDITASTFKATTYDNPSLAYDEVSDRLFLNDTAVNKRILVFDTLEIIDGEDAVNVLGQPDFTSIVACNIASSLSCLAQNATLTTAIDFDSDRQMLFTKIERGGQAGRHVRAFDLLDITDNEPAVAVLGRPDDTTDEVDGVYNNFTTYSLMTPSTLSFSVDRLFVNGDARALEFKFPLLDETGVLANGVIGTPYNYSFTTENIQGDLDYELVSGTLPPGITLGSLTGTPTTAGTYSFAIRATDTGSWGYFPSNVVNFNLTIPESTGGGGGGSSCIPSILNNFCGQINQPPTPGTGSIGNQVFFDKNKNGIFDDGDFGKPNVSVALYKDTDNNEVFSPGDQLVKVEFTNACSIINCVNAGRYRFDNLDLGNTADGIRYFVVVTDVDKKLAGFKNILGTSTTLDNHGKDPKGYIVDISKSFPSDMTADFGYTTEVELPTTGDNIYYLISMLTLFTTLSIFFVTKKLLI